MALTQAEKEHYREIIENTHGKRGERVIPEEVPASKESLPAIREILDTAVAEFLETYGAMDGEALANQRYDRFRRI